MADTPDTDKLTCWRNGVLKHCDAERRPEVRGRLLASMEELDERDFRVKGRTKFKASEIALITLCAFVTGATSLRGLRPQCSVRQQPLRQLASG